MTNRCFICGKESAKLIDGLCKNCLGDGGNISLHSAIQDNDKALIKKIEDRVKAGKIVRIM